MEPDPTGLNSEADLAVAARIREDARDQLDLYARMQMAAADWTCQLA